MGPATATPHKPVPIPVTFVTGFLGAGKTTLLNRILRQPLFAETLAIINEFGEVGLDHLLIEDSPDGMILMESGCLCCTIRGDLVVTLEDVLRRRDNGRMAHFSRLVIETTGLADPAPILNVLIQHPYLAMRFQMDGVITLVDAVNGMDTLMRHPEARRQIVAADRIVLTKTKLVADHTQLTTLHQAIRQLNPGVMLLPEDVSAGELAGKSFYSLDRQPSDLKAWLAADAAEESTASCCSQAEHHGHADEHIHGLDESRHHHDPNRHDAGIRAYVLTHGEPLPRASFDTFWALLRSIQGPRLLRFKGIVAISEHPGRPLVVHAVQQILHPPVILDQWPDTDHRSRLVLIGQEIDEATVNALWAAVLGQTDGKSPV